MFHTSPVKIEKINSNGTAGDCLFFLDDVCRMSDKSIYVYEADFNCIGVFELHDESVIADIAAYFDVDSETAEGLLDGSENEWDHGSDGEDGWWLQGKRGECAVKMGYKGCADRDEQGTVYIIPMYGRETELKLVDVLA